VGAAGEARPGRRAVETAGGAARGGRARAAAREARGVRAARGGAWGRGEEEEEEGERDRGGELTTGIQIRRSASPKPRAPQRREREVGEGGSCAREN
jgi:hypothetical protein